MSTDQSNVNAGAGLSEAGDGDASLIGLAGSSAPVDCASALQHVHTFLDTELSSADMDAIREHLSACEGCLDNFDAESALKQLIQRGCGTAGVIAPDDLRAKITMVTRHRR